MGSSLRTLGVTAAIASALLLCLSGTALADVYTVTRTDDPIPGPCEPNDCSLREALMQANGTTTVDDVVVVPVSATPYLIQYEELSLPIGDETEVRGAGADKTVVKGDGKETVFFIGAKTTLTGLTITGGDGGIQSNGDLTLRGVSVERNEREAGGGGIQSNGPLTIESSFIGFNRVNGGSGGGIQANGPVILRNSTVAWNSSEGNSGINGNNAMTVSSSAVVFNRSEGSPTFGVTGMPLTTRDSIFAGNTNPAGTFNCFSFSPGASFGGNVSDDASCGAAPADQTNADPRLGTLALHGGTTLLYDLLAGSPATDFAGQCPPLDQRGVARPQGLRCDSGPYEFVPPPPVVPTSDTEVDLKFAKGKLPLSSKGFVRLKLTCPASEVSPPCSGKVRLKTRKKVEFGSKRKKLPLGSAVFRIDPGRTESVSLRLSPKKAELVRSDPKARKVLAIVRVRDAVGNRQLIEQRRKVVPR